MNEQQQLVVQINKELVIALSEKISFEELQNKLIEYINELTQHHFEKLVSLLYRIDVSESKIKLLLQQNQGEDAAKIIASLIIERQIQKIKSRQKYSGKDNPMSDEERW